jgi:hypothetical protein
LNRADWNESIRLKRRWLLNFWSKNFLTIKFARRFVMLRPVIIYTIHRYLRRMRSFARRPCFAANERNIREKKMRKTILTILGSALILTSAAQAASATEHHRLHRVARAPAQLSEPVRNANAYVAPPVTQNDLSRYENGAYSAPAGRN